MNNYDWINIKSCDDRIADYITMKMEMQLQRCDGCMVCSGERCDIYTSTAEEMQLGKYLINQEVGNYYE